VAIENLENHFIYLFFIKTFRFFGEISPMKNRLPARRSSRSLSLSLSWPLIGRCRRSHIMSSTDTIGSLIAVHHPIPMVAHHVLNGHDRLSHRRSSPDTYGRTSCFQRTRSAFSSPFTTRYRWSHILFSTDEIGICSRGRRLHGQECVNRRCALDCVFFWIGVLKTVFRLAGIANGHGLESLGAGAADRKQQTKTTHTAVAAKSTKYFFSAHIKL
jgi:hypothetical protein